MIKNYKYILGITAILCTASGYLTASNIELVQGDPVLAQNTQVRSITIKHFEGAVKSAYKSIKKELIEEEFETKKKKFMYDNLTAGYSLHATTYMAPKLFSDLSFQDQTHELHLPLSKNNHFASLKKAVEKVLKVLPEDEVIDVNIANFGIYKEDFVNAIVKYSNIRFLNDMDDQ